MRQRDDHDGQSQRQPLDQAGETRQADRVLCESAQQGHCSAVMHGQEHRAEHQGDQNPDERHDPEPVGNQETQGRETGFDCTGGPAGGRCVGGSLRHALPLDISFNRRTRP